MKNLELHIPQIHCPACEKLIKMSLKWVEWVGNIKVDLNEKKTYVEYEETIISKQKIIDLVKEDTGYEVMDHSNDSEPSKDSVIEKVESVIQQDEIQQQESKISVFDIQWMHCSSCANIIEKSLKKVNWVQSANVNFASEKANVKYDPTKVNINDLQTVIVNTWYKASIDEKKNESSKRQEEIKKWFRKFIWGTLFSLPLLALMVYDFVPGLPFESNVMPYAALIWLILTIPVQFVIGADFYKWFWSALKMKTFNMYSLIVIWTSVAFLYSMYSYINYFIATGSIIGLNWMKIPNIYFEVSALLITFVCLWKLLEARAKWKTSEAISRLMGLAPKIARVKEWNSFKEIPVEQVVAWDIILVRPWEKIPVDWVITDGHSSIDESMLTWESLPVEKAVNSKVYTWTINKFWSFEFKTTKVGSETALSQIVRLIEEAQWSKAPIQSIADKISAIFVPAVIIIAAITFGIWYFLLGASFEFALLSFAAVIVIACPCALWLATPTAIMVGTWIWAKNWILIKWWEPLEVACQVNAIVFDKTWTITNWTPKVTDVISFSDISETDIIAISGSLEKKSEHPLAKAIVDHSLEKNSKEYTIDWFEAIPWKWIKATINWNIYYVGTRKLLDINNIQLPSNGIAEKLEDQWKTVMFLSTDKVLLWAIAVADTIKSSSVWAIEKLKKLWIKVYMITWDNKRAAGFIANQVWIPSENVLAEVLPQNKASEVKNLQDKWYIVAMVWDGINDSPALTQANLWIAMGSWADVAIESWGIIVMRNDLNDVISSIELSKETVWKIKQNMFFSLFYNVIGIPVAAGFLASLGMILRPELAWLAMALSSVSVVSNSLLLKWFRSWRVNILSKIAPFVMWIGFIFLFVEFARLWDVSAVNIVNQEYITSVKSKVGEFMSASKTKVVFDKLWLPKIFIYSDTIPQEIKVVEWTDKLNDNEVLIWYEEAQMMRKERLFKNIGDEIPGFFWLDKVKIVGILAPTKTDLDDIHILKTSAFDKMNWTEDLYIVKANDWSVKMFYLYDENNIPQKLKWIISSDNQLNVNNKEYLPLYIGYEEAKMMRKENLFQNQWDKINWLFGNNIIVTKVLKKTYSNIDVMHFVPKKFKENHLSKK